MRIKFKVFAVGEHTFHSNKTNRDIRQARLIGLVCDCFGSESPAVADMGFEAVMVSTPSSGDVVALDVQKLEQENAMEKLTFSKCEILPKSK